MSKVIAIGILVVLALVLVAPAGASLVGTAFGFPTITQTGTTTAFNRDTAAATDTEAFALSFPTKNDCDYTPLSGQPSPSKVFLNLTRILSDRLQRMTDQYVARAADGKA